MTAQVHPMYTSHTPFARWMRAAPAALALCLAIPAYADDDADCGTPAEITQRMKAEGQRSFAMAELVKWENEKNVFYGVIYTVNADLSVGYILQSDQPPGRTASRFCIDKRLENIRMFDAREPGLDPAALLRADEAEAEKRCAELVRSGRLEAGTCRPLNVLLRSVEPYGERAMFQGFVTHKQSDGRYIRTGTLATITGSISGSPRIKKGDEILDITSSLFLSSVPEGATIIEDVTVRAQYLPYGESLLASSSREARTSDAEPHDGNFRRNLHR